VVITVDPRDPGKFYRSLESPSPNGSQDATSDNQSCATALHISLAYETRRVAKPQLGVRCFHRLPMRREVAWGGENGLPHGTASCGIVKSEAGLSVGRRGRAHGPCAADARAAGGHGVPRSRGAGCGSIRRWCSVGGPAGGQTKRFVPTTRWAAQGDGCSWINTQRADTEVRAPARLAPVPLDGGFRRKRPAGLGWNRSSAVACRDEVAIVDPERGHRN
jgi:hypothetical protein